MPSKNDYTKATTELETLKYFMTIPFEGREPEMELQAWKVIEANTPEDSDREGFREFLDEECKRMSGLAFMQLVDDTLKFTLTIEDASDEIKSLSEDYDTELEFVTTARASDIVYSVIETVIAGMKQVAMQQMMQELLGELGAAAEPAEKNFDIDAAIEELKKEASNG